MVAGDHCAVVAPHFASMRLAPLLFCRTTLTLGEHCAQPASVCAMRLVVGRRAEVNICHRSFVVALVEMYMHMCAQYMQ